MPDILLVLQNPLHFRLILHCKNDRGGEHPTLASALLAKLTRALIWMLRRLLHSSIQAPAALDISSHGALADL
ncbi:MAG: hypothetical protein AB7E80_09310 [Hyphomicrobiaceae bacterium]